jgi:hypothetical protein
MRLKSMFTGLAIGLPITAGLTFLGVNSYMALGAGCLVTSGIMAYMDTKGTDTGSGNKNEPKP